MRSKSPMNLASNFSSIMYVTSLRRSTVQVFFFFKIFLEENIFQKSRDEWKISFRDLHDEMCTGLWKSLLGIKKVDEALLAAEQGRVDCADFV